MKKYVIRMRSRNGKWAVVAQFVPPDLWLGDKDVIRMVEEEADFKRINYKDAPETLVCLRLGKRFAIAEEIEDTK